MVPPEVRQKYTHSSADVSLRLASAFGGLVRATVFGQRSASGRCNLSAARWERRTLLHSCALLAGASLLPAARSRAQAIGPIMEALSRYMAGARERPLPDEVIEHAKHHVLDTVAAMVSGTELLPGHAALRFAATQTPGGAATVTILTLEENADIRSLRPLLQRPRK
jgi:hypothetical protein